MVAASSILCSPRLATSGLPPSNLSSIQEQTASGSNSKFPTPVIMESTFPVGAGGNHEFWKDDLMADLIIPEHEFNMDDLFRDESGAGDTPPDPHSCGDTSSNCSTAADAMEVNAAAAGQGQPVPHLVGLAAPTAATVACSHSTAADAMDISAWDWTEICPDLSPQIQVPTYSVAVPTITDKQGRMQLSSGSVLPGFKALYMLELNPARTSTNIMPPDSSSPCEIIEFLKREGCKRDDALPSMDKVYGVNRTLAEEDQIVPKAVRGYVTTVEMMPDQKSHDHGYWKEKQVTTVRQHHVDIDVHSMDSYDGLKKTFQFHKYDGTKTNWFMDEYIPTKFWGIDLYMEPLWFRTVYKGEEVPGPKLPTFNGWWKAWPWKHFRSSKKGQGEITTSSTTTPCNTFKGEPTSPDVKTKEKIVDAKQQWMQGPKVYYKGKEVPGEPTSPDVKTKETIDDAKKDRMQGPEVYYKGKEVLGEPTSPDVKTKETIDDAKKEQMQGLEVCYKGKEVPGEPTFPDLKTKNKIVDVEKHRMRGPEVYYKGEEVLDEPTSPDLKTKNKIVAAKKHRMRGPDSLVIKGESPVWQHFIKIYDRHPELEGSKVVYALCCHCKGVLKASTENGTSSLLKHCNDNCPVIKNKMQQPSSSSPYSTWDTNCSSAAADTGSSSLDQDFNAGAGLPQSGGGSGACTLAETPVRASRKRKRLARGSSSQRSTPLELNLVELEAGLIQSAPSSADIKPPTGSTDIEIIRFLKREESSMPRGKEVNLSLGEQDQMAPKAVRSYITTVKMMPDQNPHDLGYWKEKQVKPLREDEPDGIVWSFCRGLKRTFQFHMNDGTETNWFMHEYVPTDHWGHDLFMKPLRFREVYEGEVPEVKKKKKISVGKKHRMRCPENMVIKGESLAWQHFIKVYDKHPELEGSKVVHAVCCHCEGVLKAGTHNGTKSLLTHCDITCPVKNKNQQPSSSSYQENRFDILVGVGVP